MSRDFVIPFITKNHEANGKIIYLEKSVTEILNKHNYSKNVSNILSELMVVTTYLGQNLKADGIITSQIQTDKGLLRLLACEFAYGGKIRAYASLKEELSNDENYDIEQLIGNGHLIVTYESGKDRYQGIIEIKKGAISESFKDYLKQSEQIDSELVIFNDFNSKECRAAGLFIKKLPSKNPEHQKQIDINWEKFSLYVKSIKKDELIDLDHETLLNRLFHEEGVIVYDKQKISFECRCSLEKMQNILSGIDEKDRESLKVNGKIEIKCQFCGKEEFFD